MADSQPSSNIASDLRHCENLVSYAAIVGRVVDPAFAQVVAHARKAQTEGKWTEEIEAQFYGAMQRLSSEIAPVSAETLGPEARIGARIAIRNYTRLTSALTVIVVIVSAILFIFHDLATDIDKRIAENDKTALAMHSQLEAYRLTLVGVGDDWTKAAELANSQPALALKEELQQFATNNRQLYSDVERLGYFMIKLHGPSSVYLHDCRKTDADGSRVLTFFVPNTMLTGESYGFDVSYGASETDNWLCSPETIRNNLELKLPLLAITPGEREIHSGVLGRLLRPDEGVEQGFQKIAAYQVIRAMAMHELDFTVSLAGSITAFLLPVGYAMLGACASILRQLRSDTAGATFHPEHSKIANRSHMTCAVIVGITIGLFTNFMEGGKEASPLAIAFIAGYASDKFFLFVDRLVETFFPSDGTRRTVRTDAAAKAPSEADRPAPPQRPVA